MTVRRIVLTQQEYGELLLALAPVWQYRNPSIIHSLVERLFRNYREQKP